MKVTLVAAFVVVLAIAHGTESVSVVKRDIPAEVERINKLFQELSDTVSSTAQDVVEKLRTHELTNKAQTYLEDGRAQIQPLADKVQEHAEKIQEQLKPYMTNIEEQVRPMADNVQAQIMPLVESMQAQIQPLAENFQTQMEDIFKTLMDTTKLMLTAQ